MYFLVSPYLIVLVVLLSFLAVLQVLFMSIKMVPQSEEWTIERFGRFAKVIKPGLNFIIPFVDRVSVRLSMRERVLDVPPQCIITADNATVTVDGVVFFQIFDAYKAAYEVAELEVAITQLAITNIRTVMGEMELDKLLSNREMINAKLLSVIDIATDPWGVKVVRIEIKDITPPADLQDSMAKQMKAERDRRATILIAEADRKAATLRAEGESKARILNAEAGKAAKILEAEAEKQKAILEAQGREKFAAAEARAIKLVADAIKKGGEKAPQYFLGSKYIESFKKVSTSQNSKLILMPFETSSILSSIATIAKIGKEVLQEDHSKLKEEHISQ
ncbi:MAG: SPFH domain-containing protein [Bacteroidota bacterium]